MNKIQYNRKIYILIKIGINFSQNYYVRKYIYNNINQLISYKLFIYYYR